ncbi:hypothetical protein V1264_002353 [Littorina saxatilis]
MLPPGFKKDSRVWLHKNPKPRTEDVDKTAVLKRFLDSERGYNENSPCYFLELQGKQFKKDSRSWLYKSSFKKQQPQRTRKKVQGHVTGDCCREPEFARSNTDVRLTFQQDKLLKRKCGAFHSSDGDIISNDCGLKQVLRKKRVDSTLHPGVQMRRPQRTLSEERLNDEVNNIMTYASLNTFGQETDGERMTELADDSVGVGSEEENSNHPSLMYQRKGQGYPLQSYPSLLTCDLWRDSGGVKSDTSSSGHSKGSMDTLAPGCEDLYNANTKGDKQISPDLLIAVTDKLRTCQSESRSSVESLSEEHAQLKMMSLCASPPGSPCSNGSISEEDLKSSDVDV